VVMKIENNDSDIVFRTITKEEAKHY
jgi:hypothetical protein